MKVEIYSEYYRRNKAKVLEVYPDLKEWNWDIVRDKLTHDRDIVVTDVDGFDEILPFIFKATGLAATVVPHDGMPWKLNSDYSIIVEDSNMY